MRCPFCAHEDSQVKDSRPSEDGAAIRRRRQCEDCGARFTTFERVQLRDLVVVKKTGERDLLRATKVAFRSALALLQQFSFGGVQFRNQRAHVLQDRLASIRETQLRRGIRVRG